MIKIKINMITKKIFETHEDMNKYFINDNEKIIPDIDLKPKLKLIIP